MDRQINKTVALISWLLDNDNISGSQISKHTTLDKGAISKYRNHHQSLRNMTLAQAASLAAFAKDVLKQEKENLRTSILRYNNDNVSIVISPARDVIAAIANWLIHEQSPTALKTNDIVDLTNKLAFASPAEAVVKLNELLEYSNEDVIIVNGINDYVFIMPFTVNGLACLTSSPQLELLSEETASILNQAYEKLNSLSHEYSF